MNKIVISGYYGFDNLGDEAILAAVITALREKINNLQITVLSASPEITSRRYGVESISRTDLFKIVKAITGCDLFISGGGSLLQDVTGNTSIPYYLGLVFFAHLLGKKTMFYAQGVGPVSRTFNKKMIKWVGNRTDLITVRDSNSAQLLNKLDIDTNLIKETVDSVFVFTPEDLQNFKADIADNTSFKNTAAISVRPWGDNSYLKKVAAAGDYIYRKHGLKVYLLPLYLQQDLTACQKVKEYMEEEAKLIEEFIPPRSMINLIGNFDFFLGVRLHSLIFSAVNAVPFVGISYDPKVDSLLSELELESGLSTESCPLTLLQDNIDYFWHNRDLIKDKLIKKGREYRDKARKNAEMALNLLEE
ncbi:MAG: polysaccharide pyruvyl transferase CsaB [Bacillota bacterium]